MYVIKPCENIDGVTINLPAETQKEMNRQSYILIVPVEKQQLLKAASW